VQLQAAGLKLRAEEIVKSNNGTKLRTSQKSEAFMKEIVRMGTMPGDLVVDLMGGTGSTGTLHLCN
jgi:DNA modification methylase